MEDGVLGGGGRAAYHDPAQAALLPDPIDHPPGHIKDIVMVQLERLPAQFDRRPALQAEQQGFLAGMRQRAAGDRPLQLIDPVGQKLQVRRGGARFLNIDERPRGRRQEMGGLHGTHGFTMDNFVFETSQNCYRRPRT